MESVGGSGQSVAPGSDGDRRERWAVLWRHYPDPGCALTNDGRLADANDVLAELVGTSVAELAGLALRDLTHPDDVRLLDAAVAAATDPSVVGSAEVRLRIGTGGHRWTWWRFTADDDGRYILGLARDVTERRAGEAAAAQHAAVVASSDDAIITKALDGTILSWNPGAEGIYGYSAAEMIGRSITLLAPPGRADEVVTLLAQVARGEAVTHRETVRVRKDGRRIDVSLTVSPIHDSRGVVAGASVISRDVTRRRDVEQEQIRQVIAAAGDPFVLVDEAGAIVEWNERATQVFGWRRDEALGRNVTETIVAPRDREQDRRRLQALLIDTDDTAEGTSTERIYVTRTGVELPMESSWWRATTPAGVVVGGFLRDQTARRQVERAFAEARDQAVEAGRLKSQFLASMSHEIRTPMNAVIGLTGLLLRSSLTPVQQRHARGVQTAGEVLLSLINDILDFSKIDAGKLILEQVDFSPAGIVEDVTELVADAARSKDLEIVAVTPAAMPATLSGDPTRIRQILLNLAVNAVKFTARGEVVIRAAPDDLDHEQLSAGGPRHVLFEVSDTGCGIAAVDQSRLFEPFTQADSSTTRRHGGTGLGLAICRDLVNLMGGTLGVTSELGRGSTFRFRIPLGRPAGRDDSRELNDLEGQRVLIVDDNSTNRMILAEQLRSWRAEPTVADSAAAALHYLERGAADGRPFHLTVTDFCMPGMDGLQLAKLIKATPAISRHPVVLLSSEPDIDDGQIAEAGIRCVLLKPAQQSTLYTTLVEALRPGPSTDGRSGGKRLPAGPRNTRLRGDVLLVEDNELNQVVGVGILTALGLTVHVAADGRQAVTMCADHHYDAVLMDCHMPVMDGFAATTEIRRHDGGHHTPIIALTAAALPEDRARCAAAGMDDYLTKPITPESIEEHLRRWINHESAPAEPAAEEPSPLVQARASMTARLNAFRNPDGTPNRTLQNHMLTVLIESMPHYRHELGAAFADRDTTRLVTVAHTLKGLGQTAGAAQLATLSDNLETLARADRITPTITDLDQAAEDTVQAARQLLTT